MSAFRIVLAVLAILGSSWMIWRYRWCGAYLVALIVIGTLIDAWTKPLGAPYNAAIFVLFLLVGGGVGFYFFTLPAWRRTRDQHLD